MTSRAVIVHHRRHVEAALAAADGLGVPLFLRSAPGAAAYLGAPVFRDMVAETAARWPRVAFSATLDCDGDPGLALNAFRHGLKRVRVAAPDDVRRRLADIARGCGATLDEEDAEVLDLLHLPDPEAACREWLKP